MNLVKSEYTHIIETLKKNKIDFNYDNKESYTGPDIFKNLSIFDNQIKELVKKNENKFVDNLNLLKRKELLDIFNLWKTHNMITTINIQNFTCCR